MSDDFDEPVITYKPDGSINSVTFNELPPPTADDGSLPDLVGPFTEVGYLLHRLNQVEAERDAERVLADILAMAITMPHDKHHRTRFGRQVLSSKTRAVRAALDAYRKARPAADRMNAEQETP